MDEPGVVGHLTEVPALAIEQDLRTVDPVVGQSQSVEGGPNIEDVLPRMVTHQVEAETVDLVVPGPGHHRVDHELAHHGVLGGGVGATGRGLDLTGVTEAVVVAGHDPVQDRELALAGGVGVVVDHVHHHPQPRVVERVHHLSELDDPGGAVGIGGVRALGHGVVERVIAPVEAVLIPQGRDQSLLPAGIGRERVQGRSIRFGPLRRVLVDGGDVEHREQVDVAHAGLGQGGQMAHAVGVGVGEGGEGTPIGLRHRLVPDGEVPDVELVDGPKSPRDGVLEPLHRGPGHRIQSGGGQGRIAQIDDLAPLGVAGQRHRVGVGDQVGLHRIGGGHVDLHLIEVEVAVP